MLDIKGCGSAEAVFRFFEEISRIPHASANTAPIAEYLVAFADKRGLECIRDEADNVIIKKAATAGYENRPTVIIQGHTDMVPAVDQSIDFDFSTDALSLYVDGDFLRARGTTLGADDGIAVAYALALLDSSDIPHPAIEAVFTSDEEIGLIGAGALDASSLNGRMLINLDSDAEGVFTVGCAGGLRCDVIKSYEQTETDGHVYSLSVTSLRGGHSGVEIDKGRTNAIKVLADMLASLGDIRLISLDCGNADNAIPKDASATFISNKNLDIPLHTLTESTQEELVSMGESAAEIICVGIYEPSREALGIEDTKDIISLIQDIPTGVLAMSEDIEGLVETSENLGMASLFGGSLALTVSVRSAVGEKKRAAANNIKSIAAKHGAIYTERGEYPSWEYKRESYLRDTMCRVYREMYNKEPEVVIIHAGLECGLLCDKIAGLDCLSLGPDNLEIHTPRERLSISSATRVWEYLLEVLKNI